MDDPNLKIPEFLRAALESNQQPELVKETEWSYVYKIGQRSYSTISKFLADEHFAISASEIRRRWPTMSESQRLDFVQNFWAKADWDSNDTEILEVVMHEGNDRVWEICSQAFLRHPDRERIVRFLIERLEKYETGEEPLNYIQALGMSKDSRAVPAIRPYFERYRKGIESEETTGVPEDVVFGPVPYHAYFTAAAALLEIEGSGEYDQAIRKYLGHQHQQVRWWAENALKIEGPTTAERNAECRKNRSKD
jgi:hypothetical protein